MIVCNVNVSGVSRGRIPITVRPAYLETKSRVQVYTGKNTPVKVYSAKNTNNSAPSVYTVRCIHRRTQYSVVCRYGLRRWVCHYMSPGPRDKGPRPVTDLSGGLGWTVSTPGHLHTKTHSVNLHSTVCRSRRSIGLEQKNMKNVIPDRSRVVSRLIRMYFFSSLRFLYELCNKQA